MNSDRARCSAAIYGMHVLFAGKIAVIAGYGHSHPVWHFVPADWALVLS